MAFFSFFFFQRWVSLTTRPLALRFTKSPPRLVAEEESFSVELVIWDEGLDQPAGPDTIANMTWQCQLELMNTDTSIEGTASVDIPLGKIYDEN